MSDHLEGGCQCGQIRYRVKGEPAMKALCHCAMCRRAHAAPVVGWTMYPEAQVRFLGPEPTIYESSPGCRRGFCSRCGTQISFTADFLPGLIDMTTGSLDEPERMPPALHFWVSRQLPWMHVADELPKYPELPIQDGQ